MPFWTPKHPPLTTLLALDHVGCTLWYVRGEGWGRPDETMSARAGRLKDTHLSARILARWLNWMQEYHTSLAKDHDFGRGMGVALVEQEAGEAQAAAVDAEIRRRRDA